MPYEVVYSPEALEDPNRVRSYLANHFYPENDERFMDRLTLACGGLGIAPYRCTKRDDLAPGIRSTGSERRATIYFKVGDGRVSIIGVCDGGREFIVPASTKYLDLCARCSHPIKSRTPTP